MKRLCWTEIKSKERIHLGRAHAFSPDTNRIQIVIEKIIRGLYYHHTQRILPLHYFIEEYSRNLDLPEEFLRMMASLSRHDIGDEG
ncbi:hypothetical protein [Nitrosospira sp. NpAV]|uniref:hypothetical protein n=1 Tax=Nitrosospira sp. NpAV TaxID=58133 RepID=UPI0018DEBF0B|nr:hypothetical protein [Nitrosospira sp. NpAV]